MLTRKNLIYALIVASLLLIILNISIEVASKTEEKVIPVLSKNKIENKFALVLSEYGISSSWIKKTYVREKLSDSLDYLFKISIPQDITIATLLKDVSSAFVLEPAVVETKERKNYSDSILKIYSNGILKLQANLNHSKKIIRDFAKYSFLVTVNIGDEESVLEESNQIFSDFTYLLVPSKKSVEIKNRARGKYAVLLNDQITETDYTLKENFSKQKLVNNIRSIIISFGKNKTYLIDETSALYNSKIYSMLRDEFSSRGIKLLSLQKFPFLKGNSREQLNSLFKFYTTSLKGKKGKIFVVDLDNFLILQPIIVKHIKMGDKVVAVDFE